MSLTVYGIAASRAIRPLWVAEELALNYRHVSTPYLAGATRTSEFLALNPNGHIPVVCDHLPEGEVVVWESMACALYIARVHGVADGHSLAPATPSEEAAALKWAFWVVNEVEKDALTVLMHQAAMPAAQRKPELAAAAEKRLHRPLAVLEAHLAQQKAKGCSHLAAQRFTVADVCAASVLGWVKGSRDLMHHFPLVAHWLAHCQSRPAYQKLRALAKAGL